MIQHVKNGVRVSAKPVVVTMRDTEVLRYLAEGKRPKEVAAIMCIELAAMYMCLARINKRLKKRTITAAVAEAVRMGIIT